MRTTFIACLALLLNACATHPPGVELLPPHIAPTVAAAKAGSPQAMEAIGEVFHFGDAGVKRNLAIAFRWYEAAAKAGLPSAQDYVGMFYAGGLGGVPEDCGKSIDWFMRAASGGHIESKNNAAWMLATCPDSAYRNGKRAVELSQETIRELGRRAGFVSTLAAAYAEIGEFGLAVESQEESIRLMRRDGATEGRVAEARVRLDSFKKRDPWRGASYVDADAYRPQ